MAGYRSGRTGDATKTLLDQEQNKGVIVNSTGKVFRGATGDTTNEKPIIFAPNSNDRVVAASDRLTEENIIIANQSIPENDEGKIVITGAGANSIKASTVSLSGLSSGSSLVTTTDTLTSGYIITGGGGSKVTKSSYSLSQVAKIPSNYLETGTDDPQYAVTNLDSFYRARAHYGKLYQLVAFMYIQVTNYSSSISTYYYYNGFDGTAGKIVVSSSLTGTIQPSRVRDLTENNLLRAVSSITANKVVVGGGANNDVVASSRLTENNVITGVNNNIGSGSSGRMLISTSNANEVTTSSTYTTATIVTAPDSIDGAADRLILSGSSYNTIRVSNTRNLTESNVVKAGTTFVGVAKRLIVATANSNEVAASSSRNLTEDNVIKASTTISSTNSVVLGGVGSNTVKASTRLTNGNVLIGTSDNVASGNAGRIFVSTANPNELGLSSRVTNNNIIIGGTNDIANGVAGKLLVSTSTPNQVGVAEQDVADIIVSKNYLIAGTDDIEYRIIDSETFAAALEHYGHLYTYSGGVYTEATVYDNVEVYYYISAINDNGAIVMGGASDNGVKINTGLNNGGSSNLAAEIYIDSNGSAHLFDRNINIGQNIALTETAYDGTYSVLSDNTGVITPISYTGKNVKLIGSILNFSFTYTKVTGTAIDPATMVLTTTHSAMVEGSYQMAGFTHAYSHFTNSLGIFLLDINVEMSTYTVQLIADFSAYSFGVLGTI